MPQLLGLTAEPQNRVTVAGPAVPRGMKLVVTGVDYVSSHGASTVVLRHGQGPVFGTLSVSANGAYHEGGDRSGVFTAAKPFTATLTCTGPSSCGLTLEIVGHLRNA